MNMASVAHAIVSFIFREGKTKAVEINPDVFRKRLNDASTVGECLDLYEILPENSPYAPRVAERVRRLATDFGSWLLIAGTVSTASALGKLAFEKLASFASSFGEWKQVYELSLPSPDSGTQTKALEGMAEKAASFDEQLVVYELADNNAGVRDRMMKALTAKERSYEEWMRLFKRSESDSPLGLFAGRMLVDAAASKEAVCQLLDYKSITRQTDLLDKLFGKMKAFSAEFRDWNEIYEQSEDDDLREKILAEMESSATEAEDLAALYKTAEDAGNNPLKERVIAKFSLCATSFKEWKDLLEQADSDCSLEHLAAGTLVGSEEATPKMLYELLEYDAIWENETLKKQVLARLMSATAMFDEWKEMFSDNDADEVQKLTLGKMIETARTVDELLETGQSVDEDDDDLKEKLKARAHAVITTRDECEQVIDDNEDSILFDEVILILLGLCETTVECLELYHSATDDWTTDDEFQEKVLKKLFSLATESECQIITILAEDDSNLKSEAERHVEKK